MRAIELTRKRSDGELQRVFCNPDRIEYFLASTDGSATYVYLESSGVLHVTESTTQIIARLAAHRSTMRAEEHDEIETYRP